VLEVVEKRPIMRLSRSSKASFDADVPALSREVTNSRIVSR